MLIEKDSKIGEIVSENFRTAQVFEKYGLDFCCGGKKTLEEACVSKKVNPEELIQVLSSIGDENSRAAADFNSWSLDFLIDYIINNHHSYVIKSLPSIAEHAGKVKIKHGENHNEVVRIAELFSGLKTELEAHLQKEERMLFPYIKQLVQMEQRGEGAPYAPFGTIQNPVRMMESEHDGAGNIMAEINSLSSSYVPPDDACTTYRVLYSELKEFEDDLHVHIHLENNILFPKAIELEKKLTFQNH